MELKGNDFLWYKLSTNIHSGWDTFSLFTPHENQTMDYILSPEL